MTNFKSIKTIIATLTITTALAISTVDASAKTFTDIPKSGTYSTELKALNKLKAFDYKSGSKLSPSAKLTRGESAKIIYTLQSKKLKKVRTYKSTYKDISKNKFAKEIKWAYEVGIYDANSEKKFRPSSTLSKAQMAKVVAKAFKTKKGSKNVKFSDMSSKHYATQYVTLLASNSIITKPSNGKFSPNSLVKLNQFAQVVYKASKVKTVVSKPQSKYANYSDVVNTAVKLFNDAAYQPKSVFLKTKISYGPRFAEENGFTADLSTKMEGSQRYGRVAQVRSKCVVGGTCTTEVYIYNDRTAYEQKQWKLGMDRMEKAIRNNYKLDTDYSVVYAVNDFLTKKMGYDADVVGNSHYYVKFASGYVQCTTYTDVVAEMHKRFDLESRVATGDNHAWIMVKVGGKWYHTDSTFYAANREDKYILMTQKERDLDIRQMATKFRATNVKFDKSMALPYKP